MRNLVTHCLVTGFGLLSLCLTPSIGRAQDLKMPSHYVLTYADEKHKTTFTFIQKGEESGVLQTSAQQEICVVYRQGQYMSSQVDRNGHQNVTISRILPTGAFYNAPILPINYLNYPVLRVQSDRSNTRVNTTVLYWPGTKNAESEPMYAKAEVVGSMGGAGLGLTLNQFGLGHDVLESTKYFDWKKYGDYFLPTTVSTQRIGGDDLNFKLVSFSENTDNVDLDLTKTFKEQVEIVDQRLGGGPKKWIFATYFRGQGSLEEQIEKQRHVNAPIGH